MTRVVSFDGNIKLKKSIVLFLLLTVSGYAFAEGGYSKLSKDIESQIENRTARMEKMQAESKRHASPNVDFSHCEKCKKMHQGR